MTMRITQSAAELRAALGPDAAPALALGNFDGVHRGHQALLARARALADARGGPAAVLTFDPHPARVLAPALAPPLLVPLRRRLELLEQAGMDAAVVLRFDAALAQRPAEEFVRELLHRDANVRDVVVGYDFNFGRGRQGGPELLRRLADELGFSVHVVPQVTVDGLPCSSTKIREFVLEGRVEGASLLLGRPFELDGLVVAGDRRGRTLGFPTANLRPSGELAPRAGVYAAQVSLLDTPGADGGAPRPTWRAAVNIGSRPTFDGATDDGGRPLSRARIEAHLLDFDGDLYDRPLRLAFLARLRDERRFAGPAQLAEQIARDVAAARQVVVP